MLHFYKGYIAPNENYNCYIFKYTNKAYLLVAEYDKGQYKLTDIKETETLMIRVWISHMEEKMKLIEINRINFYAFHRNFQNTKLVIEIARTSDGEHFLQMYSKQFCGKYKKINEEKVSKVQEILYYLFGILDDIDYDLCDLKDLFSLKGEK